MPPLSAPDGRRTILIYRDRIAAPSEVQFLRRQYLGFGALEPVWVGCHRDSALPQLGAPALFLGRAGALGAIDRAMFKQFGAMPLVPDLAALKPALIHAQFGRGGALALPIARALGLPLVVTFHGGDATKDKHFRRTVLAPVFQRRLAALKAEAALFVCVSDFIADRLILRGFPRDKLLVIPIGVELASVDMVGGAPAATANARAPSVAGAPYVVCVGRFVEKKGITHLIEAIRLLAAQGSALRLVLIGDGPQAHALKQQAAGLAAVEFKGWLPSEQVRGWMQGAVALCVPSVIAKSGDADGLPSVILEAMALGVPVIGSRQTGIPEAVIDGRTGYLVPPGDAGALAKAMAALAADPARQKAFGAAGLQLVAERFDAVVQSRALEAALLSVMAAR